MLNSPLMIKLEAAPLEVAALELELELEDLDEEPEVEAAVDDA